ncbi:MAG: hypothetical protein A2X72_02090 [Burkholderiales bacterium GWF1_66_17]|nr:MAG: hypothetical protein A2X73_21470 [Burkholderiales bacterium GWE1_65_30]OGA94195.1 MAG: hypothetical protein A2X72_02090 [Burkholderiales bacterium GWF1_66_17]
MHLRKYLVAIFFISVVDLFICQCLSWTNSTTLYQKFKLLGSSFYFVVISYIPTIRLKLHFEVGSSQPLQARRGLFIEIRHSAEQF